MHTRGHEEIYCICFNLKRNSVISDNKGIDMLA